MEPPAIPGRFILLRPSIQNIVISGRYVRDIYPNGFDNTEGGIEDSGDDTYFYSAGSTNEDDRKRGVATAYRQSIEELISKGKHVYLVYPVPEVGWNVPRQSYKRSVRGIHERLTTSYPAYLNRSAPVLAAFDAIGDSAFLTRVKPSELFCNHIQTGRCETQVNGRPLYFDDDHVSVLGATIILQRLFASAPPSAPTPPPAAPSHQ